MIRDWHALLHSSIPLATAMQVNVRPLADGRQQLHVPLAPNVNDKGTGFGGSVAALATLAGWVETQRQLDRAGVTEQVDIMVQRGETHYLLPITADFSAEAQLPDAAELERFQRMYARKGLARLAVGVALHCNGVLVARYEGEYVARRAG